ncbi:ARM repeat-containing protein [Atractiella rhizophila]|nr:ARM repeat-containing protein [Atractiella rhizophila]
MKCDQCATLRLEDLQGSMHALCKDQFVCRYLQKKLEEGNPEHRDMIFQEICPHFSQLITDKCGNYLAQKLFEFSSSKQREALLEHISNELVSIALNMHGARVVQKIMEHLSTQHQVQILITALNLNVVALIRHLSGNHVVQKCLHHLSPERQPGLLFIYNVVAANCVEVATDRYGCSIVQRCIDNATEWQRIQLTEQIINHSLTLYCSDLSNARLTEAIIRQFLGYICALSVQKFSSNWIRVADPVGRQAILGEILADNNAVKLLQDSFGNYVCQTALDYADLDQRTALIAQIRPILPQIMCTPHGKRIQRKISRDSNGGVNGGGGFRHHARKYVTPTEGLGGLSLPIHQLVSSHRLPNSCSPLYVFAGGHQHNHPVTSVLGFSNKTAGRIGKIKDNKLRPDFSLPN